MCEKRESEPRFETQWHNERVAGAVKYTEQSRASSRSRKTERDSQESRCPGSLQRAGSGASRWTNALRVGARPGHPNAYFVHSRRARSARPLLGDPGSLGAGFGFAASFLLFFGALSEESFAMRGRQR